MLPSGVEKFWKDVPKGYTGIVTREHYISNRQITMKYYVENFDSMCEIHFSYQREDFDTTTILPRNFTGIAVTNHRLYVLSEGRLHNLAGASLVYPASFGADNYVEGMFVSLENRHKYFDLYKKDKDAYLSEVGSEMARRAYNNKLVKALPVAEPVVNVASASLVSDYQKYLQMKKAGLLPKEE